MQQYEKHVLPLLRAAGPRGESAGAIARMLLSNKAFGEPLRTRRPEITTMRRQGVATKKVTCKQDLSSAAHALVSLASDEDACVRSCLTSTTLNGIFLSLYAFQ